MPSADSEKKLTLFARAGRLLRACEFDKAAGVFETIVADFPEEAEAYWGLVLCKYGIEYVDDPATGKKIPTCHRSSFDNVMKDPNFEQACENTDAVARRVYRDEARAIEELRKSIIEVSGKEEPYDVFISYKETDANGERTPDSVIAQEIYRELTREGYRVFFSRISLENRLGTEYEPYIFAALNSAKVMIVVGTDYENFDSVWVKNEWSRYLKLIAKGEKKTLIPVFRDMDAYDMPEEFNKLTALDMGKIGAVQDLVHGVGKLVGKKKAEAAQAQPVQQVVQQTVVQGGGPNVTALLKRGQQALEDRDWEKARSFYDQVLSMDAENAEAFLGLFLAGAKCSNEGEYIAALRTQKAPAETLTIPPDTERIETAVTQYTIAEYLSKNEIRSAFQYDLSYPSALKAWKAIKVREEKVFTTDRSLARAIRYAKGDAASRPLRFQAELSAALEKAVKDAEKQEQAAKENKRREYGAFLADAKENVKAAHREAQQRREADYQDATQRFGQAKTEPDYQTARELFHKVAPYKDSADMVTRCDQKIAQIRQAEAEEAERERLAREKQKQAAQAKKKRLTIAAVLIVALAIASYFTYTKVIVPASNYKAAMALAEAGQYSEAIVAFNALGDYRDARARSLALWDEIAPRDTVAAGRYHTVGLKADGSVIAVGYDKYGQCEISDWTDIVAVAAGSAHTVGLKADGTVVAVGSNKYGQCEVTDWTDIVAVAAGNYHTVGLKADGTVVAVGRNVEGQCDVSGWSDIVAVAAGGSYTVGLKADGSVVAVGYNNDGQCDVSGWTDIVAVAAGNYHTVGLKADGTVVAVGENDDGQCDVSDWSDIKIPER